MSGEIWGELYYSLEEKPGSSQRGIYVPSSSYVISIKWSLILLARLYVVEFFWMCIIYSLPTLGWFKNMQYQVLNSLWEEIKRKFWIQNRIRRFIATAYDHKWNSMQRFETYRWKVSSKLNTDKKSSFFKTFFVFIIWKNRAEDWNYDN